VKDTYSLKQISSGGEPCPVSLAGKWYGCCDFYNEYGPTEATVTAIETKVEAPSHLPLGKPIPNTGIYILDRDMNPVPIGVNGEIYIGGFGVARGYLNNPELTAEKFCLFFSPFTFHLSPLYKTGDLGRWLPDGNIEFSGRRDHQVKIRGFRIELGEIESRLLRHPGVKEAVVLAAGYGANKYLCAYIAVDPVGANDNTPDNTELRRYLSHFLPGYMIPPVFVPLDSIPLTPNGKIDRSALPEPEPMSKTDYVPCSDEIEATLLEIWCDVLNINRIGIDDNFFDLGGHSLKATLLISRVHKILDVRIPLAEVFKAPSIRGLARCVREMAGGKSRYASIEPSEKREYYPLSSAQKRLYILQQIKTGSTRYNMPAAVVLEGELDREKLAAVFQQLIRRHESLRTSFHTLGDTPVQKIHDPVDSRQWTVDSRGEPLCSPLEPEHIIPKFVRSFDLSQGSLLRVGLIKQKEQSHILVLDMHHIISDGISAALFQREFMTLYSGQNLPELRLQYKDYSLWQDISRNREKKSFEAQETYWFRQFEETLPVLNLPYDYPRPAIQEFTGEAVNFSIGNVDTEAVNRLAASANATLFMTLLSVFTILLSKFGSREDIAIGTPIAGRRHVDMESIMGMFVNTLVLRNNPSGEMPFREFLKEVRQTTLAAFENQDYPFEELVEKLSGKLPRDTGRNPLFDVMFALQNLDIPEVKIPGLALKPYRVKKETTLFDLTLTAAEIGKQLAFRLEYCTSLFKRETVERFACYFKTILSGAVKNPGVKISEIDILSPEEKQRLVDDFNDTKTAYPADKTIDQLVEEQANKNPDGIAVGFEEALITYKTLNRQAGILAARLRRKGIREERVVAVPAISSLETIISILAILKAGGTYMPVGDDLPGERKRYMINQTRAETFLALSLNEPFESFKPGNQPHNAAYILFTSGSTGRPKAVVVEHRGVVRLVKDTDYIRFKCSSGSGKADRVLQVGALDFDASTFEIWGALLNGLSLFLADRQKVLAAAVLKRTIETYDISVMLMTTPLFHQVCQAEIEVFRRLRHLLVGGDVLSPLHLGSVKKRFPYLAITNAYGPTENTVISTSFSIPGIFTGNMQNIPIGKPIANSTAYILDRHDRLVPVGVTGELCVGGDGLARGYLNDPELTAERFCLRRPGGRFLKKLPPWTPRKNFFSVYSVSSVAKKIYKTGDLARWLPGGNIQFLGRSDQQVKIRGYRIELGEIENHLLSHDEIKEVVVLAKGVGDKYLCAYIVPASPGAFGNGASAAEKISRYLSTGLPAYMIPSSIIPLEKIPLTVSGKVDRKALPEPEAVSISAYTGPRDEIEKKLALLWSEILLGGQGYSTIGIDDNFFHLGGHSLKAALLVSGIHKELKAQLPLAEIFKFPTIRQLAAVISFVENTAFTEIEKIEAREFYELSYQQKRLWTHQHRNPESCASNLPGRLRLLHKVDEGVIPGVLSKIIARHESFRTVFKEVKGQPVQRIEKNVEIPFKVIDISSLEGEEKKQALENIFLEEARTPFDLSCAPIFRSILVKVDPEFTEFIFTMHLIISDGWSLEILKKEFMGFYEKIRDGQRIEPEPLRLQYRDFAAWQNLRIKNPENKEEAHRFWLSKVEEGFPPLQLPWDFPGNKQGGDNNARVYRCVVREDSKKRLKTLAEAHHKTIFAVMFAVFNRLLARISGQQEIVCRVTGAGRDHVSLTSIGGYFTNHVLVKSHVKENENFIDFLNRVDSCTREALQHQVYPFERVLEDLRLEYPAVAVTFNFLTMYEQEKTIELENVDSYHSESVTDLKVPLTLQLIEYKNGIEIVCKYPKTGFKPSTVENLFSQYLEMLEEIID